VINRRSRGAGQAGAQLALLSRLGTTSRTTDSEYLFWAKFSFHGREILPQTHVQKWSILNSYGYYLRGTVVTRSPSASEVVDNRFAADQPGPSPPDDSTLFVDHARPRRLPPTAREKINCALGDRLHSSEV
jgi:hypothetical protein